MKIDASLGQPATGNSSGWPRRWPKKKDGVRSKLRMRNEMETKDAVNNNPNIVQAVRAITAGSPVRERCSTTGRYVISMESGGKTNRGLGPSKGHRCRREMVHETIVGSKRYESSSASR